MTTSFGAVLGVVLFCFRQEQRKTQIEVATALDVGQAQYAKMEHGRVNINMFKLEKLRQTFELDSVGTIFKEVERLREKCADLNIKVELRNTPLRQSDDLYGRKLMTLLAFGNLLREKTHEKDS